MAIRGGPLRRVPGSPLAGVLQEMGRQARRPTRTSRRAPLTGPDEPVPPAPQQSGPPASAAVTGTVVRTDSTGMARWEFPAPFPGAPVVTGAPTVPALLVVEEVTERHAVVRLHSLDGSPAPGGAAVHLTATATAGR